MKNILIALICVFSFSLVGCSSTNNEIKTSEVAKTFVITDGETYEDIESLEGGYIVPTGKWKVTKLEDSNIANKITLSSDINGNEDIVYSKAFELDVKNNEKLILMMAGEGMQLYFEEIKD